jgi:hypothetical protein
MVPRRPDNIRAAAACPCEKQTAISKSSILAAMQAERRSSGNGLGMVSPGPGTPRVAMKSSVTSLVRSRPLLFIQRGQL